MKKILLASVAVCGLAFAAPAHAEIELDVGGYFKGYGVYADTDSFLADAGDKEFDFVRDTELHIGGETTLDNGLTVGAHIELGVDGSNQTSTGSSTSSVEVDESYVYFSGDWGRVNFGEEDGAAYLLQVAVPSGDTNIDGIRQFVSPFGSGELDYAHDIAEEGTKLTYLSPIFSGFQVGASYATDSGDELTTGGAGSFGVRDDEDGLEDTLELAVRYEGQFQNVGVIAGGAYSFTETGEDLDSDDINAFNVGLDLDIAAFGIGAAYVNVDGGEDADIDIYVVGADYTTGPFKIGASYYNIDSDVDPFIADGNLEADRYTVGATYQYGPGMSLRGSVQYLDVESDGSEDAEGIAVLIGSQINF